MQEAVPAKYGSAHDNLLKVFPYFFPLETNTRQYDRVFRGSKNGDFYRKIGTKTDFITDRNICSSEFKSLCPCQRKVRNSLYSNEFRTFFLSCVLPKSPVDVGAVGAKVGANQKSWCKSWCKLLFQIQVMLYDLRHGQTPCRIF